MPPITPAGTAGSRTALVGWTVVTSILFVVATIFAIYFYVDSDRVNKRLDALTKQYTDVVPVQQLQSEAIERLRTARQDPEGKLNPQMNLMDVALALNEKLSRTISGSEDQATAVGAAKNAIAKAKAAGAKPAGDSLSATIDALVTDLTAARTEAANNKRDSDESKAKLQQTIAATAEQVKTFNQTVEQIRTEKDAALQEVQRVTQEQSKGFEGTAEGMRKQLVAAQEQINQVNSQNADLGAEVKKLQTELDKVLQRLNDIRVDPTKAVTRQPDGRIVRLPGNNICFIDLGSGHQVTPGLTFEIFDKIEGIPAPGDPTTEENLPTGKASIEVLRVGPTSSECRITRLSPGATLSEGDLVVNLVYDKNTKYNFLVYGNFDLDQNGVPTAQDTEVVKRLVTQWGGNIVNDVNVDTDFVLLGKEPVIPDRPDPTDPIATAKYDAAVAESDAYAAIRDAAQKYRIPILNQNRFLYLVGYYEQAKR
jgi:hypothetical protein